MKIINGLMLFLFLALSVNSFADTFIRSIEYAVSTDQTLNEARKYALNQIKIEVLSEVGSLVEAEIKSSSDGKHTKESVNYSQISAGVVKVKILNEFYDGKTLLIEAEADVDSKDVVELIETVYSVKKKDDRLRGLIERHAKIKKDKEVITSENQLLKIQLDLMKQQIQFIEKSKVEADFNNDKLNKISNSIAHIKSQVAQRIKNEKEIFDQYNNLASKLYINGMTLDEFSSVIPVVELKAYFNNLLNNKLVDSLQSRIIPSPYESAYAIFHRSSSGAERVLYVLATKTGKVSHPRVHSMYVTSFGGVWLK